MNPYEQAVSKIIQEQQTIIGPIAFDQARKVAGIKISGDTVEVSGNGKEILDNLVKQYSELFGQASVEVCKEAIRDIAAKMSPDDLPEILK